MNRTNVLLAEDDVNDYLFFVEAFEKVSPSYNLVRAKNGLECITFLKNQEKPGIIFLDLNMPIKNGLECLKFIKDNEALADIPVIMYSTSYYIKHIDAAFKNSAHYYIVKPRNADDLAGILKIVVTRLDESLQTPPKENFVLKSLAALEH